MDIGTVLIIYFVVTCVLLVLVFFRSPKDKGVRCPRCGTLGNFLTQGMICQECAWEEELENCPQRAQRLG